MQRSPWTDSRLARVAIAVALAVSAAGGCATGSSEDEPGSATPSVAAPSIAPSGSNQLPAPIIVAPDQTTAEARVGETIVFDQPDPANTMISTDRPDVLDLTQGDDDGSALFNPAATALAPGVAVVTIEAKDGTTTQVTVTVR
jgi:hypothetical protein